MRILTEAVRVWLAANELEEPEPALEYQAGELGLEVDNEYVRVVAEFYAVMSVIQAIAEPVEPSEADQREVYDHLVAEGLTRSSFDDAKQVLTQEVMGHQVAIRDLIVEALALAKVRVNPRFDFVYKVPVPVGSGQSWLEIPLRGRMASSRDRCRLALIPGGVADACPNRAAGHLAAVAGRAVDRGGVGPAAGASGRGGGGDTHHSRGARGRRPGSPAGGGERR